MARSTVTAMSPKLTVASCSSVRTAGSGGSRCASCPPAHERSSAQINGKWRSRRQGRPKASALGTRMVRCPSDIPVRIRIFGYQGSSSLVQNCFDLEIDVDPVPNNNAAGLEDGVEVHPEIAALEFTDRREPGASAPERIGTETAELEPQRNRLRNGLQGQLSVDDVVVTVGAHTGRPERHRFVRVDLEE